MIINYDMQILEEFRNWLEPVFCYFPSMVRTVYVVIFNGTLDSFNTHDTEMRKKITIPTDQR